MDSDSCPSAPSFADSVVFLFSCANMMTSISGHFMETSCWKRAEGKGLPLIKFLSFPWEVETHFQGFWELLINPNGISWPSQIEIKFGNVCIVFQPLQMTKEQIARMPIQWTDPTASTKH